MVPLHPPLGGASILARLSRVDASRTIAEGGGAGVGLASAPKALPRPRRLSLSDPGNYTAVMAPIIPPGNLWAQYFWRLDGDADDQMTTMGWEITTPPYSQVNTGALYSAFLDNFQSLAPTSLTFTGIRVVVGSDGDNPVFESSATAVGTSSLGSRVPQNTATLVKKPTGFSGRRNRGRMYLWAPPESEVDNVGTLTTSYINDVNTAIVGWVDDSVLNANVDGWVILHSEAPSTPTIPLVGTYPRCDNRVATQRRRLRP